MYKNLFLVSYTAMKFIRHQHVEIYVGTKVTPLLFEVMYVILTNNTYKHFYCANKKCKNKNIYNKHLK